MKIDAPREADGISILNMCCKRVREERDGACDVKLLYHSHAFGQHKKYIPFLRQETYIPLEAMYYIANSQVERKIYGEIM